MRLFNCKYCQKEKKWHKNSFNIFCSCKCSGKYRKEEHKRLFWLGQLTKQIDRSIARKYLIEVRGCKCEVCGLVDWQEKPLVLQVDHIDGNPGNDQPDNLRLICPNCHSQTAHYGGKNKGFGRKTRGLSLG